MKDGRTQRRNSEKIKRGSPVDGVPVGNYKEERMRKKRPAPLNTE